jgi:2-dehydropantoate 2-reductase
MRIAVIGAGGIGGWLAARMWAAGSDVHVLAQGPHLEAIRERGLALISPAGDLLAPVPATADPTAIGPCDVVLLCVKAYDTDRAAALLPALCAERTVVASLQNGIENAERLTRAVGAAHVVGGLALISSSVVEPGVVRHSGGPARVVFGDLVGNEAGHADQVVAACRVPGVDARSSDRIEAALWDKFAFLCALAGTTATTRLPLGEVRACPASWAFFQRIVAEVFSVARAVGVVVDPDAEARQVAFAGTLEPHIYASLYHDLVAGRQIELDALHATVVRLGARHGVPTPASAAVEAILRPHADRAATAASLARHRGPAAAHPPLPGGPRAPRPR